MSTFPGSTNIRHWHAKKTVFFYLDVCVCVCEQKNNLKKMSVDILRTSKPTWMKIPVFVAISLESRTFPSKCSRTNISPIFEMREMTAIFWMVMFRKQLQIYKNEKKNLFHVNFEDLLWLSTFSDITNGFMRCFDKKTVKMSGAFNVYETFWLWSEYRYV